MIEVGLIILYILIGILVFVMCQQKEDLEKYDETEWYKSFYKKPRFYRISVRLFRIIFWPFIIIYIISFAYYIGAKYIY